MGMNVSIARPMDLYPKFRCVAMEDSEEIESLWREITGDSDKWRRDMTIRGRFCSWSIAILLNNWGSLGWASGLNRCYNEKELYRGKRRTFWSCFNASIDRCSAAILNALRKPALITTRDARRRPRSTFKPQFFSLSFISLIFFIRPACVPATSSVLLVNSTFFLLRPLPSGRLSSATPAPAWPTWDYTPTPRASPRVAKRIASGVSSSVAVLQAVPR